MGYYLVYILTHFDTADDNIRVTFDQVYDVNVVGYVLAN